MDEKIEKYILDIVLPLDTQKKYKPDLKPLISLELLAWKYQFS
jgi:hypothetical protein